jgi:hypothetical protein
MILLLIVVCILVSVVLFILFERLFWRWSTWQSMVTAALLPPVITWTLIFGVDVYGAVRHSHDPGDAIMAGLSLIGFPIAMIGFPAGVIAILGFCALRMGFNRIVASVSGRDGE